MRKIVTDYSSGRNSIVGWVCASELGWGLDICGQATKSIWGMSWHQKAKKGVEVCEKPGVVDKRTLIPGFPNQRALNT